MEKTMLEMNNTELFNVLAGSKGVMPQMYMQDAIRAYRKAHGTSKKVDLHTMLVSYVDSEKR